MGISKKIPNKGRGFFIEAKSVSDALNKAKKKENNECKIVKATRVSKNIAPAFKKPFFISIKRNCR